jgi:plastocyanin
MDATEVTIENDAYSPASVTVQAGATVKWENYDEDTHTVTSDSILFDSGNLDMEEEYSYKFNEPGTYPYHCKIHSTMHGTIIVQ